MTDSEWSPAVRPGAWAAVDTGLLRHRKLAGLKGRADVLYLACVLHCADDLTDGRVRSSAAARLLAEARARRADFDHLVAAGALEVAEDGDGWTVPGYLEWNPPRAWWDRKRELGRERQKRFREAARRKNTGLEPGGNALGDELRNGLRNAGDVTKDKERSSRALAGQARTQATEEPCLRCGNRFHPTADDQVFCPTCEPSLGAEKTAHKNPHLEGTPAPSQRIPSGGSRTLEQLAALLRDA